MSYSGGRPAAPQCFHNSQPVNIRIIMESFICLEEIDQLYNLDIVTHRHIDTTATEDRVLVRDGRVLANMLAQEASSSSRLVDYCSSIQTEIAAHMRKIVTDWMLEVCEDQQCPPQVFFLATTYLDTFLSRTSIRKNQFQLLASVCLLLASKFSCVVPVTTDQLVIYTDNSVTKEELHQWELLVLETLQWELSVTTVNSFLQHFYSSYSVSEKVRATSLAIAAIAVTEYKFLLAKDSVIAGAALAAAVKDDLRNSEDVLSLITNISSVINCKVDDIFVCMYHLMRHDDQSSCKRLEKTQSCEADRRPTTPDDVLNISQSEIIV